LPLKRPLKINVKKVKKTLDKIEKVCYNSHYIGYDDKGGLNPLRFIVYIVI